jgi:hypothetical protein
VYDWLFEGRLAVYLSLLAFAVVCLVAWQRTRRGVAVIAIGIVLILAGLYFMLDRLVETDREQIERKLLDMAANVQTQNVAAIFSHVSEDFRGGSGAKERFRQFAESHLQRGDVTSVAVRDIEFPEDFRSPIQIPGRQAEGARFSFRVNTHGGIAEGWQALGQARFVRDPDGQWRLFDFRLFNPVVNSNEPIAIPGL